MSTRRQFLASGLTGLAIAEPLAAIRARTVAHIGALPVPTDYDDLGKQYTLEQGLIYLNHGSIGTIPRVVQEARAAYLATCETNPWLYMWSSPWEAVREDVRAKGAGVLGCAASEVAITHNTTEGFSLLAGGLPLEAGDEVVYSNLNHDGASVCWSHFGEPRGVVVRKFELPLDRIPEMTAAEVIDRHAAAITERTRVLVFPHVDNMVGLRHPVQELAAMAKSKGVEFVLVDGAQAVGMMPVTCSEYGVDAYATSPHKWLQAPKGLGLCYLSEDIQSKLRANWVTWGQRRWANSVRRFEDYGTRNLPEVLALGDAIAFQTKLGIANNSERLRELRAHLRERVREEPKLQWKSPETWELGGSLHAVAVEGVPSSRIARALWPAQKIVFRAFGGAFDAMRITPNVFTTKAQLDRFVEAATKV